MNRRDFIHLIIFAPLATRLDKLVSLFPKKDREMGGFIGNRSGPVICIQRSDRTFADITEFTKSIKIEKLK